MQTTTQHIEKTTRINATPEVVWQYLTAPELMKQWMGEPEMKLEIVADWKEGGQITVSGFHHVKFENKGTVLQFVPNEILCYSHLSSVSRLPDKPENYSIIKFELVSPGDRTLLTISLNNFPTKTIFRHLEFYWKTTAGILKTFIETGITPKQ